MMQQVLFSRYEDGARPVKQSPTGWEVEGLTGAFTTAKGLLAALTGHPEGRHWSLERYFRIGAHGPKPVLAESQNVLDLFPPLIIITPGISIPQDSPENAKRAFREKNLDQESVPGLILGPKLGIDLSKRANEVRKLLFAGFGRRMFISGYDPDDVLQEVYRGILVRNAGTCPWDERKSSFGHYVHMVISCVLSNYHRKAHRVQEMEQLGLPGAPLDEDSPYRGQDVASNTSVPAAGTLTADDSLVMEEADDLIDYMQDYQLPDDQLATRVLPLLLKGIPKDHMHRILHTSNAAITRAITHLRIHATGWRNRNGLVLDSLNPT